MSFLRGAFFLALMAAFIPIPGLAAPLSADSSASSPGGEGIFREKRCGACHQTRGPGREKTIAEVLAKKGPELWYAGSKFSPGFLAAWLAAPEPIRPMKYYSLTEQNPGDHPRLDAKEASLVAAYLMGLTSDAVAGAGITPSSAPLGKSVFIQKMACYGCHQVRSRGKLVGGLTGPRLSGAAERLKADWIYAFLRSPGVFKPVMSMPVYEGYINDGEMKALAAYISGL